MKTYVPLKPHVITPDIIMPETDGIEIIQWLNDIQSTSSVIILSGGGTMFPRFAKTFADVQGSLHASVLPKPFKVDELRATLSGGADWPN